MADERRRLGIPEDRRFQTKIELGWEMIQRVKARGLPFDAVLCDELYGRSGWLRAQLRQAHIPYMANIPRNTRMYLHPVEGQAFEAWQIAQRADTRWQPIRVRATERGELNDEFAARRVWTHWNGQFVAEWLVIRRHGDGQCSYALSNQAADTPLEDLAWLKCMRHFVECCNQDAKSEAGWDEFQAQRYRAWEHHLALTVLACWFVAQTRWAWAQQHPPDPSLAQQFGVDVLPALSMANVRELLRAVMPLSQFTPEEATDLVVEHLVNRTRSRRSRLRHSPRASPQ
jgi:SRSO17 transposase